MNINLFEMALDRLRPSDWEHFEKLASSFLVADFPSLRTMASPSGDGGRDSELFSNDKNPVVAIQYSVTTYWDTKIKSTVKRLQDEFPDRKIIVYMTNQVIGAKADKLRSDLISKGLMIDIRDRNWFLERYNIDDIKLIAAEKIIESIARPYLAGEQVIEKRSYSLSSQEARAALLYLGMQWKDDITEKSLTKLSYEALVRSSLRNTNSENRKKRTQVYDVIQQYLPTTNIETIKKNIDNTLKRLTKRYIRHWEKEDEFCLTHEEFMRLNDKLADSEKEENQFTEEVRHNCVLLRDACPELTEKDERDIVLRVKRIINQFLLERGETFASSVISGDLKLIGFDDLKNIIFNDITKNRPNSKIVHIIPNIISNIIVEILTKSTVVTQKYLRCLVDSYTLFAFLREVPDVQSATKKIFSYGEIWLDTTVLLPLFAETFADSDADKRFTSLFRMMSDAGIVLKITSGVAIEIISHMNISAACARHKSIEWRGRIPYLYFHYLKSGRNPIEFANWLELFRGDSRPEDDIVDYLNQEFSIERESLEEKSILVSEDLRWAVERLWAEAHKTRRSNGHSNIDEEITIQLIQHDVENYLGVVALRETEQVNEFGYKHWWLTLDSIAWQIRDKIKIEFKEKTPPSPLLSLDFLVNNLAFGPNRRSISKETEQTLPLMFDLEVFEFMPTKFLEIAEKAREENQGLPEYVIRRKVRDACDRAKRKAGCITKLGLDSDQWYQN